MGALAPIGRLLFSAMFILSGINHFTQREALVGYARSAGVPLAELGVFVSGVMLLLGGLAVLLGLFARTGAALIALFLVAAALFVHDFWNFAAPEAQQQQVQFFKNLALAGGALLIIYFGPGPYSLRQRVRRPRAELERTRDRGVPPLRPRPQE